MKKKQSFYVKTEATKAKCRTGMQELMGDKGEVSKIVSRLDWSFPPPQTCFHWSTTIPVLCNDGGVCLLCEQICVGMNAITSGFLTMILSTQSPFHLLIWQLFANWPTKQAFILLKASTLLLEYNRGLQSLALRLSKICFQLFFFLKPKKCKQ